MGRVRTSGSVMLTNGMPKNSKFSASFSAALQSRARSDGMVNIQRHHILCRTVCCSVGRLTEMTPYTAQNEDK